MIRYKTSCVECAKEFGCVGDVCKYARVEVFECDECGDECDAVYVYDGSEMCEACLIRALIRDGLIERV